MLIQLCADVNGCFACLDDNNEEKTRLTQLKLAPLWHPADIRTPRAVTSRDKIAGQRRSRCQLPSGVASEKQL